MRNTLIIVFAVLSLTGFIMTYIDKHRAIRHQWRIPEKTFYLVGLLGGSVGIWIGMFMFHHKTRKNSFVVILLVDLIFNFVILYLVK